MLRLLVTDNRVDHINFVVSGHAHRVLADEIGLVPGASIVESLTGTHAPAKLRLLRNDDIAAGIASGSYPSHGMVVLPCSMGTLASITNGLADKLIPRAADVCLKERRPLILCVRETPFNRIHLRNMTLAAEAGATIFPVIPALYFQPQTIDEIAQQFCCRVLNHLDLPQPEAYRWKPED